MRLKNSIKFLKLSTIFLKKYEIINDNNKILLHKKVAQILEFLLKHPNQIVTKAQILSEVYGDTYITDSTFRGYMNKIKIAIGEEYLRNIRGEGYIFETV